VTDLHERLLDVDAAFDLVFCPCLVDTKKKDVMAMPDGSIALTLFNGAIRSEENAEMAELMRAKSAVLVAFGACACHGGVPGIANLTTTEAIKATVYSQGPTIDNAAGTMPQVSTVVPEGRLELPELLPEVKRLVDIVDVDYFIPGCPPEPHQIWAVLEAVINGQPLPPKGSVLGGGTSTVCIECPHRRADKKIDGFRRVWEFIPDPATCLLEQGLVCMGLATRDGCGALCPRVQMPCIGCYGPPEGVEDQGAKMAAALGSMIDIEPLKHLSDAEIIERIDRVLDALPDFAGTAYKFSVPGSLLKAARPAPAGADGLACPSAVAAGAGIPTPAAAGNQ
jgi:F420-non-reducing hydrogenase small subunit